MSQKNPAGAPLAGATPLAPEEDIAVRLRMAIARLFRRIERTRAGVALTPSETTVLSAVVRQGPLRLSELAKAEGMNPTMLSRLLRDLEEEGLVRRRADRIDRRAALAEATQAGRRLHEKIRSERSDALSAALVRLSADEQDALRAGLPVLETLAEQLKGRRP
ncbi:MAG TPA: MarR family transcriptional regulator [Acidimicrobiales bacterium]|nr:MarR family transcriptional regulator [Acidimicrobiales bacterium]